MKKTYGWLTVYAGEVLRAATKAEFYAAYEAEADADGIGTIEVDGVRCFVSASEAELRALDLWPSQWMASLTGPL